MSGPRSELSVEFGFSGVGSVMLSWRRREKASDAMVYVVTGGCDVTCEASNLAGAATTSAAAGSASFATGTGGGTSTAEGRAAMGVGRVSRGDGWWSSGEKGFLGLAWASMISGGSAIGTGFGADTTAPWLTVLRGGSVTFGGDSGIGCRTGRWPARSARLDTVCGRDARST